MGYKGTNKMVKGGDGYRIVNHGGSLGQDLVYSSPLGKKATLKRCKITPTVNLPTLSILNLCVNPATFNSNTNDFDSKSFIT